MPTVSVIIPCFNEEQTIGALLTAIYNQSYPLEDLEVVIADGLSTDRTRAEIEKFQITHPDLKVQVVDNPKVNIPSGLNRALEAAVGEYIIRLDAHSIPFPDYIDRCVENLESGMGESVGGVWEINPGGEGWIASAIALATSHPFGVGDARYRVGGKPQLVETVPFGAFKHTLIDKIGKFNETLLTNEDYEFNVRIKQSGGGIWFDPAIRSKYYARSSLSGLARQYWRYGFWKARMLRTHPKTIRWRQLIPPLFVFSLIAILLFGFFYHLAFIFWGLEILIYFLFLCSVGLQSAVRMRDWRMIPGVAISIAVMHILWGSSFLWSLVTQ
jgi:glycosyltransferase involved in cell wall biosynthesis